MKSIQHVFLFFVLASLSVILMAPAVLAKKRVALVIGNSSYKAVARLPNPASDAKSIAASLKRLGFAVTLKLDQEQSALRRSLGRFARSAAGADIAISVSMNVVGD